MAAAAHTAPPFTPCPPPTHNTRRRQPLCCCPQWSHVTRRMIDSRPLAPLAVLILNRNVVVFLRTRWSPHARISPCVLRCLRLLLAAASCLLLAACCCRLLLLLLVAVLLLLPPPPPPPTPRLLLAGKKQQNQRNPATAFTAVTNQTNEPQQNLPHRPAPQGLRHQRRSCLPVRRRVIPPPQFSPFCSNLPPPTPPPPTSALTLCRYYLKSAAAGGICCSITHGALCPVDVVKTRIQLGRLGGTCSVLRTTLNPFVFLLQHCCV